MSDLIRYDAELRSIEDEPIVAFRCVFGDDRLGMQVMEFTTALRKVNGVVYYNGDKPEDFIGFKVEFRAQEGQVKIDPINIVSDGWIESYWKTYWEHIDHWVEDLGCTIEHLDNVPPHFLWSPDPS